ncbi:MAG: YncE family protein [Ilumatobacteraceae bacterium]|nr:YncE family protein [Ilumatobacteraceae bacterium]
MTPSRWRHSCDRTRIVAMLSIGVLSVLTGACSSTSRATPAVTTVPTSFSGDLGEPTEPSTTTTIARTTSSTSTTAPTTTTTEPPTTTTTIPQVYSHTVAGQMSPAVATAKNYVYVPSNNDGSVTVIDQATMTIVKRYKVGRLVQHVVAGWDLTKLYATVSGANRLVEIDPATGDKGASINVAAPYNLYFTPDGSTAIVMAERLKRMDFYDRLTWKLRFSVPTPCNGINHADWSLDETWFLATCEFSGQVLKVDTATGTILGVIPLPDGSMPQDLRLAPDGTKFYVADMEHGCVWIIDGDGTAVIGSIETGKGPHGIYPSRDGSLIYVTNRGRTAHDVRRRSRPGEGSVSVIDPKTDTVTATWLIPGGGSPDMGGVSADGTRLWLSGRFDAEVYVFDTTTGAVLATIPVPSGPHGLAVFPQPGRYSLGHTGNYR